MGMGLPIRFSDSFTGFDRPAPGMGEHNAEVYGGLLGHDDARMESLRAAGVI